MTTVVIGDSISFGQYLSGDDDCWPTLVGGIINRSVCNDTSRLMLERFPRDVQELEPQRVIIQVGHNDANCWKSDRGMPRVSLFAFRANLQEMVERCRRFDAEPILCTITPAVRDREYGVRLFEYNDMIKIVCKWEDLQLIDARSLFMQHDSIQDLLLADGLHLSALGQKLYAEAALIVLSEMVPA